MANSDQSKEMDNMMKQFKQDAKLYNPNMSHSERIASTFKSTDLTSNDKFLGIDLDPSMVVMLRGLWDQTLPYLSVQIGDHAIKNATKFAQRHVTKDPVKALEFGNKWGKAAAYSFIFAKPIAEMATNAYNTGSRLSELRSAISTVMKANGKTATVEGVFSDAGNEVIHNARNKVFSAAWNELAGTVAGSVALAPAIYSLHNHHKEAVKKQQMDTELEMLAEGGTPEQFDAYVNKQIESTHDLTMKFDKQLNKRLSEGKKEYMQEFERFKRSHEATKLQKEVMEDPAYYLDRYGIKKSSSWNNLSTTSSSNSKKKSIRGKKVDQNEGRAIEARLKEAFAEQSVHGAWDNSFQPAYSSGKGKNRPKTKSEIIRESHENMIQKIQEKAQGAQNKSKDEKEISGMATQGSMVLGTLVGEVMRKFVSSGQNQKLGQQLALDMILNFRRQLDENRTRSTIPGGKEGNKSEEYSYAQYVHKIFQEHQQDCGLSEIGDRYVKSMRAVNWSDEEIQKMKDSDLNEYEVAIKHISQYIRDGRMDALALINLVGERKIVQRSGKAFGTLQTNDQVALKENVTTEIDHQAALLRPRHKMDQDEVSQALGNYTFTKEELQAAFSNHGLDADAKAFLFTLLDMNTPDDEVLKDLTGRPENEIKQLRLEAQKHFSHSMDAALREIADDLQNNPAAIARFNLTEEEAARFKDVYRKAQETESTIGDVLNTDNRNAVAASVANILVDDMDHGGTFWRDRVKPRAHDTEINNKQEAKEKQEEEEQIKQEALENETSYAERVAEEGEANDNYVDSMPYVSKKMQEHSKAGKKSHAHKSRREAPPHELGIGA